METLQQDSQRSDRDKQQLQQLSGLIGRHVLTTLGRPGDLQRVQVRRLWENHYRVNVLVGLDAASVKVAHSYFLVVDSAGTILHSTPRLGRQYEPDTPESKTT